VVFDTDRDGNWEVYIMGPDGENPLNLSNNEADDTNPAISPDGKRVAFVSNRESEQGGGQNIYVVDADGSNLRQLTFQGGSDGPDWSYDGAMIVYSNNGDIYFTDANDGSNPKQVTFTPEEDKEPKWSPDGSKLAWLSGKEGHYDVLVSSPDGSDLHPVTDTSSIYSVYWTADGRLLIDSWGWKDKEEFCHNCVVDMFGENIEDAGGKGEVQRFRPFWNGNGDRVELVNISLDGGPDEIFLVGEVFPDLFFNMTNNASWDRNPDWPAKCGPEYAPTAEDLQPAQEQPAPQEQPAEPARRQKPRSPRKPKTSSSAMKASRAIRSWPT
jgi:Periplasmic component of the Tol biopolymer transport system